MPRRGGRLSSSSSLHIQPKVMSGINNAEELTRYAEGEKIDWHNYEQIHADSIRKGPGEQGVPLHLKPEDEHEKQELYKVNGFNGLASDRIALNRSIPDIRHPG
ncbi:hypothetical protein B566_EDAN000842 [Ephemera danica]|nr:hypothetical protein B566_EDAN000842 [Ephemera danica]